jgi:succinate dehydrogenase / fumarate reductase flavoprotein subunit
MMQDLVGIVRREEEMQRALDGIGQLKQRAERASVTGNREYNAGWHTAVDLHNLLAVSEMIALAALERKESRGAHFRDDYPAKDENYGKFNILVRKSTGGEMNISREPIRELPADLKAIVEEMK